MKVRGGRRGRGVGDGSTLSVFFYFCGLRPFLLLVSLITARAIRDEYYTYSGIFFYKNISRTSAVSSTNFGQYSYFVQRIELVFVSDLRSLPLRHRSPRRSPRGSTKTPRPTSPSTSITASPPRYAPLRPCPPSFACLVTLVHRGWFPPPPAPTRPDRTRRDPYPTQRQLGRCLIRSRRTRWSVSPSAAFRALRRATLTRLPKASNRSFRPAFRLTARVRACAPRAGCRRGPERQGVSLDGAVAAVAVVVLAVVVVVVGMVGVLAVVGGRGARPPFLRRGCSRLPLPGATGLGPSMALASRCQGKACLVLVEVLG